MKQPAHDEHDKRYKTICNKCGKDVVGVAGINWNEGFKQGYAKAFKDIKIIMDHRVNPATGQIFIRDLQKEIKELKK